MPVTVVVADDNEGVRKLYSMILTGLEGIEVYLCEDGEKLVAAVRQYNPAIILTDLDMPVMDGLKAIEQIRKEGFQTPAYIISGNGKEGYQDRCNQLALCWLDKGSIGLETLEKIVNRHRVR